MRGYELLAQTAALFDGGSGAVLTALNRGAPKNLWKSVAVLAGSGALFTLSIHQNSERKYLCETPALATLVNAATTAVNSDAKLTDSGKAELQALVAAEVSKVERSALPEIASLREARKGDLSWVNGCPQNKAVGVKQIQANATIEDRYIIESFCFDGETILMAGVIDGHSGPEVAEFVRLYLRHYVEKALNELKRSEGSYGRGTSTADLLSKAVVHAYENLDMDLRKVMKETRNVFRANRAAGGGACCAMFFVTNDAIVTANTGDSKGVLLRKNECFDLNFEFNAEKESERRRLSREHPNDEDAVFCKRVYFRSRSPRWLWEYPIQWVRPGALGVEMDASSCYVKGRLQCTRTFGDFHLKDPDLVDPVTSKPLLKNGISFPYITVTPEVRVTPRKGSADRYMIVGSDGVWDFLKNDDVVTLCQDSSKLSPEQLAEKILVSVVCKAAEESGMSVAAMVKQANRRNYFDDTTVLVVDLQKVNETVLNVQPSAKRTVV